MLEITIQPVPHSLILQYSEVVIRYMLHTGLPLCLQVKVRAFLLHR